MWKGGPCRPVPSNMKLQTPAWTQSRKSDLAKPWWSRKQRNPIRYGRWTPEAPPTCVSAWGLSHDRRGVQSPEFNEIKCLEGSRRRRWGSIFDQHSQALKPPSPARAKANLISAIQPSRPSYDPPGCTPCPVPRDCRYQDLHPAGSVTQRRMTLTASGGDIKVVRNTNARAKSKRKGH